MLTDKFVRLFNLALVTNNKYVSKLKSFVAAFKSAFKIREWLIIALVVGLLSFGWALLTVYLHTPIVHFAEQLITALTGIFQAFAFFAALQAGNILYRQLRVAEEAHTLSTKISVAIKHEVDVLDAECFLLKDGSLYLTVQISVINATETAAMEVQVFAMLGGVQSEKQIFATILQNSDPLVSRNITFRFNTIEKNDNYVLLLDRFEQYPKFPLTSFGNLMGGNRLGPPLNLPLKIYGNFTNPLTGNTGVTAPLSYNHQESNWKQS